MTRVALALVCVLACGGAHADEPGYSTHYENARALVHSGDLRGAIAEFDAAYAISPKPELLFNKGMLYRKLAGAGDVEAAKRAIDNFQSYLQGYRSQHGADPPDASTVDAHVAALRALAATGSDVAPPSSPSPAGDAMQEPPAPAAPPLVPSPKEAAPAAAKPSAPATTAMQTADDAEPATPVRRAPPSRSRKKLMIGLSLIGAGAIGLAAGGGLLGVAGKDGSGLDFNTVQDFKGHVTAFEGAGATLLCIGALAAAAGVVALVLPVGRETWQSSISISPSATGLVAVGTF